MNAEEIEKIVYVLGLGDDYYLETQLEQLVELFPDHAAEFRRHIPPPAAPVDFAQVRIDLKAWTEQWKKLYPKGGIEAWLGAPNPLFVKREVDK